MQQSQDYIQLHIPENLSTVGLIKKKSFSSRKEKYKGRQSTQLHNNISTPGFFILSSQSPLYTDFFYFLIVTNGS